MNRDTRLLGKFSQHVRVPARMRVPEPTLVLDLAGRSPAALLRRLLRRTSTETLVGVTVPHWFGMADRHQVVTYLDSDRAWPVALVSPTLAGVYGLVVDKTDLPSTQTVLCLDVRRGWSAGLVQVEPGRLTEVACWGAAPHELAGGLDDARCVSLVDHLFTAASAVAGIDAVSAVLVIDDGSVAGDLVCRAVAQSQHAWARCPVFKRGRHFVTNGAALIRAPADVAHSVGALTHALAVRADGDLERPAMHVVAAQHSLFPSTTRQSFQLGPNDGSPLHFDVYEQRRGSPGAGVIDNRLVLRAHLVRERGYDQNMVVSFDLGDDGLLRIGPVKAWRLDWQAGSLDLDAFR